MRVYCKVGNFREGLFSRNLAYAEFVKIESSRNGAISLLLTDIGKSCPSREFLTSQICLFNAICENKILAKFPDLQYI